MHCNSLNVFNDQLYVFQGLFSSGLMVTLMIWCVQMRGPLFVSVFSPLLLVLVALVASLLLEERLYLGR